MVIVSHMLKEFVLGLDFFDADLESAVKIANLIASFLREIDFGVEVFADCCSGLGKVP